jgi:Uma2 family endonuclease
MATGLKTTLDYEDYCAIPPDGKRYELIEGKVHVTPAPSPCHQELVGNLFVILRGHFRSPAKVFISPIDVILTPHDVVQPDLVVVANPSQVSSRGIEGAPLLAI